jgi:hypothetical protein
LKTTSSNVALYIYGGEESGGFKGMGPVTEMMIANDACFTGGSWEPYAAERSWTLEPGTGWRSVYVKSRDGVGRTAVVSDTIYLGQEVPLDELGLHLASSTIDRVTLWGLSGGDDQLPYVQFSQNWFVDDTLNTLELLWGNGERVSDADARGGTAFRLRPGEGESRVWVWSTDFFKDTPLVAYFRLKVNDNTSTEGVARISVSGGGTEYGPLSLKGTDFTEANVYQEFPIDFTFHDNSDDVFLIFNVWRSGQADVYVDGATIFTVPRAVQSPITWTVPGGNYRGGGIWVRYTDDAGTFSPMEEADLTPERIAVRPTSLLFLAERGGSAPPSRTLTVEQEGCESFTWSASDDAAWLDRQREGKNVRVSVDTQGLDVGRYETAVVVEAAGEVVGSPVQVPVALVVSEQVYHAHLPLVLKGY